MWISHLRLLPAAIRKEPLGFFPLQNHRIIELPELYSDLCYKPEGEGSRTDEVYEFFQFT
jgi:hypothetical protein